MRRNETKGRPDSGDHRKEAIETIEKNKANLLQVLSPLMLSHELLTQNQPRKIL